MCLVVDTCCLASVFDPKSKHHREFIPVLRWITVGKGRLVYGGTKYNLELKKATKFLRILLELQRQGRVIQVAGDRVDAVAATLKAKIPDPKFNDEHIAAIVIVSRCRIVCTNDDIAISFLRRAALFAPYKLKRPKIYRHRQHLRLCCDGNLSEICKAKV